MNGCKVLSIPAFVAAAVLTSAAYAQNDATTDSTAATQHRATREDYRPEVLVDDAVLAIGKLKRDPHAAQLLSHARGVLVIPHFVKAAAGVGGAGGVGVLLMQHGDQWGNPVFYRVGGASVGLQVGGAEGPVALLLMNDKAVSEFDSHKSKWSLNGSAGLAVVKYSAGAEGSVGDGDVVLWSGVEGLFGGASVGVDNIRADEKYNREYYGQKVTREQILSGNVDNPHGDNAKLLRDVLPLRVASK